MQHESRVQRWRHNKRQQGLKHVSVWLTEADELRLKDLSVQEHCSPSQIMQRALAQYTHTPQHSSPADTLQIRRLILAELAALGIAMPHGEGSATGGDTGGPPETIAPQTSTATDAAQTYQPGLGHSLMTEPTPQRKGGRPRSALGQRLLDLLADHPEGLTAEQMRGLLSPDRPIGDTLAGMRRLGTVRAEGQGRSTRYFAAL